MIGYNGKVVAEANDINTVTSVSELLNGRHVITNNAQKKIVTYDELSGNSIVYTDSDGIVHKLAAKANAYLCTDANGDLMFKTF